MKKLEISRDDLRYNLNQINNLIEKSKKSKPEVIAVAKSNGMGLDLVKYSEFLTQNGINKIAVSNLDEAMILSEEKLNAEIIMLTPTSIEGELNSLIDKDIVITIGSKYEFDFAEKICAQKTKKIKACIKIDTGFYRYGFVYNNVDEIVNTLKSSKNIEFVYCFSHLSNAINENSSYKQFNRFMSVKKRIEENGINNLKYHICNSTGFLKYDEMWLDCVRLGSCIQGRTLVKKDLFKKIGTFKSNIAEIKNVECGETVSYGDIYRAPKKLKLAVIPVGYMDGFNYGKLRDDYTTKNNIIAILMEIKKLFKDNSLKVIINGKNKKVVGRLGMYHCIVDITDIPEAQVNQEVQIDMSPIAVNSNIRREYI